MLIDATTYRHTIGQFTTGVTVVTTATGGRLHGTTVSSLASVSLDPLLLLICIDAQAHAHEQISTSGKFAVNILAEDQEDVSIVFAEASEPEQGRLRGIPFRLGESGAPIIEGCLAYLECAVAERYAGGDHTIFLGEVLDGQVLRGDARPLLYFRSRYRRIGR